MKKFHSFAFALMAVSALSACSKTGDDPAGRSGGWGISAGVYSNLTAEKGGLELDLPQGDQSNSAQFRRCVEQCPDFEPVALRRGLNGVSFTLSQSGRTIDVMVTPASEKSVLVSVDWGDGVETQELLLQP